jgi:hypothetical protein
MYLVGRLDLVSWMEEKETDFGKKSSSQVCV